MDRPTFRPHFNRNLGEINSSKISYIIVKDDGTVAAVSPLTFHMSNNDDDPVKVSNQHLEEVILVFDKGNIVHNISGTSLRIEIPCLLEDHIFVLLPLARHQDGTLIKHIYAIKMDKESSMYMCQVESHLRNLDHSLPAFQSLRNVYYSLGVYRHGNNYSDEVLKSNEYTAGAILYLAESSDVRNSDDFNEVSVSRDDVMLLRDHHHPVTEEVVVGSQLIVALPSRITALENYPSDTEESHFEYNRPVTQEVVRVEEQQSNVAQETGAQESGQETVRELVHEAGHELVQEAGHELGHELVQEAGHESGQEAGHELGHEAGHELVQEAGHESVHVQETEQDMIKVQVPVDESSPQTTLSSFKSCSLSYLYSFPADATFLAPPPKTHRPHPQACYQPSVIPKRQTIPPTTPPLASETRTNNQQNITQLPLSICGRSHGELLYTKDFFSKTMPSGNLGHFPKYEELDRYPQLGQGTNGKVIKFVICEMDCALKYTKYRKREVEICSRLNDVNIVPFLGVVVIDGIDRKWCCQIMPCMTGSLRNELLTIGGGILHGLETNKLSEVDLRSNLAYILKSILKPLNYLKDNSIEIQDLKDSNVLIYKTCRCPSVYSCQCLRKYCVELSDFDSVCISRLGAYRECNVHRTRKSPDQCAKVLGTPGYKAPEKFIIECECDGVVLTGSWTDIWSFGVVLVNQFLGINNLKKKAIIEEANILAGQLGSCTLNSQNPQAELITPHLKVIELMFSNSILVKEIVQLIWKCIKAKCEERPTPRELLTDPFFTR